MITLEDVNYRVEGFSLRDISLEVKRREYFVLLGPTGAGKTLLLELIAGLHTPDGGRILIDGVDVTHMPPERRGVGFVYQDYSLFPHMRVEENIAFGLRMRKLPREEIDERVNSIMESMGISHLRGRYPETLSGGEQQRVSLARALAINPKVLLLDEPLSALDPRTRETLRDELRRIHKTMNITTIHVTHDQVEAVTLADRIGVMMDGEIIQVGTAQEVFNKPVDERIASFTGVENILDGRVVSNRDGVALIETEDYKIYAVTDITEGAVKVFIRPESIVLSKRPMRSSARNTIKGRITGMTNLGPLVNVEIDGRLKVYITKQSAEEMRLKPGGTVYASFKATSIHISKPPGTG